MQSKHCHFDFKLQKAVCKEEKDWLGQGLNLV